VARVIVRRVRRVLGLGALAALVIFLLTPTGCYLSRAGWEEAKILKGRRPITRLVADTATDPVTRAKLRMVLDARQFAQDSVGLKTKESFTAYTKLSRDTLVLLVSAAHRDRLQPYTWWFPIVGRVPYKGFFDFEAARRLGRDLEKRGFDVYLRPAAAFSTLGFFNDPVLSTTLRMDTISLANTVIHELTHNTFYAKGQAVFNESFAEFVGARGAEWFFRSRGQTAAAERVVAEWEDEKILADFWSQLYRTLDSAFKAHPGEEPAARAARLAVRDTVFALARQRLRQEVGPRLTTYPPTYPERARLDNAALLARRVYATDLALFDAVFEREGRDVRRAIARILALARSREKDPYGAVRDWLQG
jgi:predicted aminopeptidase